MLIKLCHISTEDADFLKSLIVGAERTADTTYRVNNIIYQELYSYRIGDKSLDEVIEAIENRVSTFINEG